jgi:hypothetical protein
LSDWLRQYASADQVFNGGYVFRKEIIFMMKQTYLAAPVTLLCTVVILFSTSAYSAFNLEQDDIWVFTPLLGEQDRVYVPLGSEGRLDTRYECKKKRPSSGVISDEHCNYAVGWDASKPADKQNNQALTCTAQSGTETRTIPFNGQVMTIGAWQNVQFKRPNNNGLGSTPATSNKLITMAGSGWFSELYITATLPNTSGTAPKPLKVTCQMSLRTILYYSIINGGYHWATIDFGFSNPALVRTFYPQISAAFSVSRQTADIVKHRTRDEGIHIYKLDFSRTVWYQSRTLKHTFAYSDCGLASAYTTLHYDDSIPHTITGTNYNAFNPGITLNLATGTATRDPQFAYFRLRAKKSSAGTYNCSVTLTQTVE